MLRMRNHLRIGILVPKPLYCLLLSGSAWRLVNLEHVVSVWCRLYTLAKP